MSLCPLQPIHIPWGLLNLRGIHREPVANGAGPKTFIPWYLVSYPTTRMQSSLPGWPTHLPLLFTTLILWWGRSKSLPTFTASPHFHHTTLQPHRFRYRYVLLYAVTTCLSKKKPFCKRARGGEVPLINNDFCEVPKGSSARHGPTGHGTGFESRWWWFFFRAFSGFLRVRYMFLFHLSLGGW